LLHKISALEVQKGNSRRVSVYLDGRYAFGLQSTVAAKLQVGQTLSPEESAALQQQDGTEVVYGRALHYLGYRPRSLAEIRSYLLRRGVDDQAIEQVLARLAEADLVNDDDFARFWVQNREMFRPRSEHALRYELRSKGVADQTIANAVGKLDEDDSAYRAAMQWARTHRKLDYTVFVRRLGGFLQRRGFGYGVIRTTVTRVWQEMNEVQAGDEKA
jgi:regulatory protein